MTIDEIYIKRCIQLAKNGLGTTYPNPLVGSVIVHQGKIIGEGWHYQAGEPHAEVHAINSVKDTSLLIDATIYVSLEPCSHYGKTPPCCDLIIAKGIKKVVIGTIDPFAKVSGTGIQRLINAGCDVKIGILEKECQELNKRFLTYHNHKRPYVILKWAETADGFIAPKKRSERAPAWITNTYSRQLVHKWRAEEQSILVGNQTVIQDNPKLTIRDWSGIHPIRISIDLHHKIPKDSKILDQQVKTMIVTTQKNSLINATNLLYEFTDPTPNIADKLCNILHTHTIQSILVEGGTQTIQSFIDLNLWDEARVFKGTTYFKAGIKAPVIKGTLISEEKIIDDHLKKYRND
ncbi:bifunctional diaminohydroxyphosphoribosylaminopyrimidine deaminase/5-amino-6-(5-phosphoribosylamino)uracil reductase RibD [Aquimarina addita]|uniref:Riboflavin biosynthesis protein RibD n=1 Tax=Aquimarina addita TaxID=870485 RepID=A0ABP6USK7_9FLAO